MRRTPRRNRAVIGVLALLLPLAACTEQPSEVDPARGQVERTATINALNLVLVTDGDGVARLIGTLVNEGEDPDRLIGLDVDAEGNPFTVLFADGPFVLPVDTPFQLYRDAQVTVASESFRPGYRVDLTLAFADSEPITTTVPIERNTGIYADVEVTRPPDGDIRPGS